MKLADWLYDNSMTPGQLRRMLNVNRTTIHRYLNGQRTPTPERLQQIIEITQGVVTLADFLDPAPPECAITAPPSEEGDEPRTLLPWSPEYQTVRAELEQADLDGPVSSPLDRAMKLLGSRAVLTRRGTFLLDGKVSDPRRIVAAANRALKDNGEPPIPYPGVDPIDD